MYQYIDGNCAISVNDWCAAGLTLTDFYNDKKRGQLQVVARHKGGDTLIAVDSIRRADRMRAIELAYGKAQATATELYALEADTDARAYYAGYSKEDGTPLDSRQVAEYTKRAILFGTMKRGLDQQIATRAKSGTRLVMKQWYAQMLVWYTQQCYDAQSMVYGLTPYTNVRSFERAFKAYLSSGYVSLIHGGIGNTNTRKVSRKLENLLLSLWRTHDKPFVHRVWELYGEFISGATELYDTHTGEVYRPQDFMKNGKPIEISEGTVWNYLKNVLNTTAVYADRNGQFDYSNRLRPKNHRHAGEYSLSKISMDDVALSRKSTRGWVYKYIAVDVVSGYYFRPAYIIGKPNERTVYESFRNMFCELNALGLPMPGELEVEHHLMSNIPWLEDVFRFVRFCQSPTEKRAEHNIRSLKWGTAKDMGQTRGRWYAKHEAYRSIRNKVDGDYTEPTWEAAQVIADDLAAIEAHNNELHPLQKKYPGMTRKDVLMQRVNPNLKTMAPSFLYRFIGNMTETSIRNNDYCQVNNQQFELKDFGSLKRLQPNNSRVTAYWLPDGDEEVKSVYLYQGETYIGEAENRGQYAYNECAAERTEADETKMLHQYKRAAKFDAMVRERRQDIGKTGRISKESARVIAEAPADIVIEENAQPANYEQDEFNCEDYISKAIQSL